MESIFQEKGLTANRVSVVGSAVKEERCSGGPGRINGSLPLQFAGRDISCSQVSRLPG